MCQTIVILTGNHLCHNPRVVKEGTTLARAGYEVTVLGSWYDKDLKAQDLDMEKTLRFSFRPVLDTTVSVRQRMTARVSRKIALIGHQYLQFESPSQLGYAYGALSRAGARQPADLYIAHSESAMAVAADLQRDGRRVGIDAEDWFSEDLVLTARKHRPLRLLRRLERRLLTTGAHSSCPSRAMSEALASEFRCAPPAVIYNAFPWSDRRLMDGLSKDREHRSLPSVHWFSQTIGEGRGLEDLLAALLY